MTRWTSSLGLLIFLASGAPRVLSETYHLRLGPASLGNGGANPLGLPPTAQDVELSLVTRGGFECSLGLPGLLFGRRMQKPWGGYVSLGGGLVVDANGGGVGVYSAFGWERRLGSLMTSFEIKQALGVGGGALLAPYAFRFGVGFWNG